MKKKCIVFLVIILSIVIIIVEFFPFGYSREKHLPNTSIYIYKEDVKIYCEKDFIKFLKNNTDKYDLIAFEDSDNRINWDAVEGSVEIGRILWRKYYSLEYTPIYCNIYFLKVTSNGNVYDYRSCGI